MYIFRKAQLNELPELLELFQNAIHLLAQRKIPQWQNNDGPTEEVLKADIQSNRCYILLQDEKVVATGTLITEQNPAYEAIDGKWAKIPKTKGYIAIHRFCTAVTQRNHGLATTMLQNLIQASIKLGYTDIRIDTHRLNLAMQHVIQKNGFQYRGIVQLPVKDGERFAYQWVSES